MTRLGILVSIVFACSSLALSAGPAASPFEIDKLDDGIWLFRVPSNAPGHTNSLVVDLDSGLLVVESQPSPEAARQLILAIGRVSDKPIRYLVLGHAGVSSSGGASAFPTTALVIGSAQTREALEDGDRDLGGDTRLRSANPKAWTAPPRVLPNLVLGGRTGFAGTKHFVELLPIARGHYPGSITVVIEEIGLYYVGAMAAGDRNPYADVEWTNMYSWVSWVNSLVMQHPETIVPMRGKPLDEKAMRTFRDALGWVIFQVEGAFADLVPSDEILDVAMDKPELAKHFDVEAEPFLVRTLFERARLDGLAQRKKRHVDYDEDRKRR